PGVAAGGWRRVIMNGQDLLRIVDLMHREKNIPKEVIFEGIEAALQLAAERAHGGGVAVADDEESDEPEVVVTIDRMTGAVKAVVMEVRKAGQRVKVVLSRCHPDFVRCLFENEIPEIADHTIDIRAIAREAGYRTKIAVSSIDTKVDAVGACVGVRGSRIKNIVDELGGEKIDIVRWNESSQILISNALKPAEVAEVSLCFELGRATVVVNDDQLSLAIGKRGQNVRLAARLTGWDIDILTPPEFQNGTTRLDQTLKSIEGIIQEMIDKVIALGLIDVRDIEEVGTGPLMEELGLDEETAQKVVDRCAEEAKIVAVEQEAKKKAEAAERARLAAAFSGAGAAAGAGLLGGPR